MSAARRPAPSSSSFSDTEIDELQSWLDAVPAPLEPLDVSALDGFLVGVLLQQPALREDAWLPLVTDVDARALPRGLDASRLHALVRKRRAELDAAISARRWFDPWVFELDPDASPSDVVLGWVAGFATAMEHFPALADRDEPAVVEALALLYRHLDPDDLEDADALLEAIESLEPPADADEAVEDLVQATLLLADVTRPLPRAAHRAPPRPRPRTPRRPR